MTEDINNLEIPKLPEEIPKEDEKITELSNALANLEFLSNQVNFNLILIQKIDEILLNLKILNENINKKILSDMQ